MDGNFGLRVSARAPRRLSPPSTFRTEPKTQKEGNKEKSKPYPDPLLVPPTPIHPLPPTSPPPRPTHRLVPPTAHAGGLLPPICFTPTSGASPPFHLSLPQPSLSPGTHLRRHRCRPIPAFSSDSRHPAAPSRARLAPLDLPPCGIRCSRPPTLSRNPPTRVSGATTPPSPARLR